MPVGVIDALAERVRSVGFLPGGPSARNEYRLEVDRPAEPGRGYRDVGLPARSLHLIAANGSTIRAIALNEVRVWREDERTLRYLVVSGGWFWRRVFAAAGLVSFALAATIALTVLSETGPFAEGVRIASLVALILLPVGVLVPLARIAMLQRWSRRVLEAILTAEIERLQPIGSGT
jgi:hypothetical protein